MADNVTLNAGSGGDDIAADDVAGVKYQVVKMATGGDGVATPVSGSDPIPASLSLAEKTEGDAASAGGKGIVAFAVRKNHPPAARADNGDNTALISDGFGRLYVNTDPIGVGGWSSPSSALIDIDETPVSLSTTAGRFGGGYFINLHTAVLFVKVWDRATAPTVGSDAPRWVFPIAPDVRGIALPIPASGLRVENGLFIAATGGVGNDDATAIPGANLVVGTPYWI